MHRNRHLGKKKTATSIVNGKHEKLWNS